MEEYSAELPEAEDIAAPPDWMMKKIMHLSPEQQKMMPCFWVWKAAAAAPCRKWPTNLA